MSAINVLFDTNILIPLLSGDREFNDEYASILRLSNKYSFKIFYHPSQIKDFERDVDQRRKKINLSRLKQFQMLANLPGPPAEIISQYHWTNTIDNDRVDNFLLYALLRNAIHILVTNDKKILNKAIRAGLAERTYTSHGFYELLCSKEHLEKSVFSFGLRTRLVYEFPIELSFWDSLKENYLDFRQWHAKCASDQRECWCVCDEKGELHAICIYDIQENENILTSKPYILEGRALKLCTFKVDSAYQGLKLGERFLFHAFKYAHTNNLNYIFIHLHNQIELEQLLVDFGFSRVGRYNNDWVYVKDMRRPSDVGSVLNKFRFFKRHYPFFYDGKDVKKYIVPIQPSYHDKLFPDVSEFSQGLFKDQWCPKEPEANTIKKAYICQSRLNSIQAGDVLVFYKTGRQRGIETLGVVESATRFSHPIFVENISSLVVKRTVYSKEELQKLSRAQYVLVILFRVLPYLKKIDYDKIQKVGIKVPIQTIREITNSYDALMEN